MSKKEFNLKIKTIKIYPPLVILPLICFLVFFCTTFKITTKEQTPITVGNVLAASDEVYEKVYVSRVIDGDTVELSDKRVVRIIGINAPEDTKSKERLGDVATNFAKETLEKKYVFIEKNVSETDKYDRLLRTIWLEKPSDENKTNISFIKEQNYAGLILTKGLAKTMTIEPDNFLQKEYTQIAKESQNKKVGIWAFNSITKGDF